MPDHARSIIHPAPRPRHLAVRACRRWLPLGALGALTLLAACAPPPPPEQAVRAAIAAGEAAAEARDVGAAMNLVSGEYADASGRDRNQLRAFVRGYFALNPKVELLIQVESVEFPADRLAKVRLRVGSIGSGRLPEAERFDLEFVEEGGAWRLRRADVVRGP